LGLDDGLCDLAFIGHMCLDEVVPYQGTPRVAPGSAVLCGALAAARVGKRVAVITRMAPQDRSILAPMQQAGIEIHLVPSAKTTSMKVVHPTSDVDERELTQLASAGFFALEEIPRLTARQVHLAGITDQEFDLELVRSLRQSVYRLSADMQSFVRQVQPGTGQIAFRDVPEKAEIARHLDMVKLDVVEAKLLTGSDDLETAARTVERWGCPEVVITRADGVLARAGGRTFYEKFTNRSVVGRTGRGDTTFAGYMARRLDDGPAEALRFAAALVSIKMETPGPFQGTLDDVLSRMNERS
jgi:sugar/nucleoside kinase (ribokinase family)